MAWLPQLLSQKCCYLFPGFIGKCAELDFAVVCFPLKFPSVGSAAGRKLAEGQSKGGEWFR